MILLFQIKFLRKNIPYVYDQLKVALTLANNCNWQILGKYRDSLAVLKAGFDCVVKPGLIMSPKRQVTNDLKRLCFGRGGAEQSSWPENTWVPRYTLSSVRGITENLKVERQPKATLASTNCWSTSFIWESRKTFALWPDQRAQVLLGSRSGDIDYQLCRPYTSRFLRNPPV